MTDDFLIELIEKARIEQSVGFLDPHEEETVVFHRSNWVCYGVTARTH